VAPECCPIDVLRVVLSSCVCEVSFLSFSLSLWTSVLGSEDEEGGREIDELNGRNRERFELVHGGVLARFLVCCMRK
jgi:hypothetical protein